MKYELYNADCLEKMKDIPDKSVDLIVTDPPYLVHVGASGGSIEKVKKVNQKDVKFISKGYSVREVCEEFIRIMKKINIYIWCNKVQIPEYFNFFVDELHCNFEIICWHKTNALPTYKNKYLSDTEYCLYFRKGGFCDPSQTPENERYENAKTFYIAPINHKDKKLFQHPTIKPLDIITKLVKNSSRENDLILDCFLGSGTTGVACINTNRNFIGIEKDSHYFEIAKKRLEEAEKDKATMLDFGEAI